MARADGARASHTFSSARLSPAPSAQAAAASRPWAGLPGRCSPAAHPDSAPRRCRGLSRPPAPPSQLGLAHPPGAPRDLVLGWWARRGGLRADAAATGVLASPETSALVPALFPGSVGLPLMSVPKNPGRGAVCAWLMRVLACPRRGGARTAHVGARQGPKASVDVRPCDPSPLSTGISAGKDTHTPTAPLSPLRANAAQ